MLRFDSNRNWFDQPNHRMHERCSFLFLCKKKYHLRSLKWNFPSSSQNAIRNSLKAFQIDSRQKLNARFDLVLCVYTWFDAMWFTFMEWMNKWNIANLLRLYERIYSFILKCFSSIECEYCLQSPAWLCTQKYFNVSSSIWLFWRNLVSIGSILTFF